MAVKSTPKDVKDEPGELAKVETENTALIVAHDDPFAEHAAEGLENVGTKDLLIPRITILQGLSPQINPKKPEYIKGVQMNDICDVGTGEVFESPLLFLPVYYRKQWLEWAPKGSGNKPPVAIHDTDLILEQCSPGERDKPTLPSGNTITETAQFYGLNLSACGRRSFLPMASTQLKKARKWLTLASSEREKRADGTFYTPPLYFRVYSLSVVAESDGEHDWGGWRVERGDKLRDIGDDWRDILREAQDFRESIKKGEVRGDIGLDEGTDTVQHDINEGSM